MNINRLLTRIPPQFNYQTEREAAVYLCTALALAYLNDKAATQDQRDELPPEFYWAQKMAQALLAEASARVLPEDTEVVGAVFTLVQLPKE